MEGKDVADRSHRRDKFHLRVRDIDRESKEEEEGEQKRAAIKASQPFRTLI